MAEEENNELGLQKKSKSKLSSRIVQKDEGPAEETVNVFYSTDNWETNEKIVLSIEKTTTISQMADLAICQVPSLASSIDCVMLFKKKKQRPNYDYPICNPDSTIGDYDKYNFCLIQKKPEENDTNNNNKSNEKNDNKEKENNDENNEKKTESKNEGKNESNKNKLAEKFGKDGKKCIIF